MRTLAIYEDSKFTCVLEDEEKMGYVAVVQGLNPENLEEIHVIGCGKDMGPYKLLRRACIDGNYIDVHNIQLGKDKKPVFVPEPV